MIVQRGLSCVISTSISSGQSIINKLFDPEKSSSVDRHHRKFPFQFDRLPSIQIDGLSESNTHRLSSKAQKAFQHHRLFCPTLKMLVA